MTYKEIQDEVLARLAVTTTSTFFTLEQIKNWINQAIRWACLYKKWPFTEGAKCCSSRAGRKYYDYPPEFRSDSIRRLEVDGEVYKKVSFSAFQKIVREDTAEEEKVFSDYMRFYFIWPVIKENGKIISVWGQQKPQKLEKDGDTTPFHSGEETGDEAIIKKTLSIALAKAKKYNEAAVEREEAKMLLEEIWARIQEEQAAYQSKDVQYFDVPKFF